MKSLKLFFLVLVSGLLYTSCGDDDPKEVELSFQATVGEEALMHETTYNINGTDVQFTNVAFYLGDMQFKTSDNVSFQAADRYHLIRPGVFRFSFESLPTEGNDDVNLTEISFFIGVDAETNAETEMDFTERAEGDPLGQQNPSMHWGWAGGYRFMNIDGMADTDGDGEFETQLTYHIGKNDYLQNITLNPNQKLEGGKNEFQVNFDIAAFLSGIDFSTENFTKTQPDNIAIADKLYNNYNSAVSFVK